VESAVALPQWLPPLPARCLALKKKIYICSTTSLSVRFTLAAALRCMSSMCCQRVTGATYVILVRNSTITYIITPTQRAQRSMRVQLYVFWYLLPCTYEGRVVV
jgi:hypothetical protein